MKMGRPKMARSGDRPTNSKAAVFGGQLEALPLPVPLRELCTIQHRFDVRFTNNKSAGNCDRERHPTSRRIVIGGTRPGSVRGVRLICALFSRWVALPVRATRLCLLDGLHHYSQSSRASSPSHFHTTRKSPLLPDEF